MAGMLVPARRRGGRDALGKGTCPRGKPAGNIGACHRLLWPGARSGDLQEMGVSTHLAQPPLETRVLGLAAPRQGSAACPVSDIQIQRSWDELCLCPLAGEGLLVQARLGSSRAEPQLRRIGQSQRISFPDTSFSPLLMCERPTRGGS